MLTNTRPLGMVLVQQGVITVAELEAALVEQAEVGGLLGEVLIRRGFASRPDITSALAQQFGLELDAQSGFGSGLRSQIQRHHDVRRDRGRAPAPSDATAGSEDAEWAHPPDPGASAADGAGDGHPGRPDDTTPLEPADAERVEMLLTLVAERDATIARVQHELTAAKDLHAVVEDERARSGELAAAVETLEQALAAQREADAQRAHEIALLQGAFEGLERELEARPAPDVAVELDALRQAQEQREQQLAEARAELAHLRADLERRPGAEAALELERALADERARAEERHAALADEADGDRRRMEQVEAELEVSRAELEELRDAAATRQIALAAARHEVQQLEAELIDRPTRDAFVRISQALDQRNDQTAELSAALAEQRARSEELAAALADERGELAAARGGAGQLEQALAAAREQLAERERDSAVLDELRSGIAEAAERERALAVEREELRAVLQERDAEAARLHAGLAEEQRRGAEAAAALDAERSAVESARATAAGLEQALAATREQLTEREGRIDALGELEVRLAEALERQGALAGECDALREALDRRSDESEALHAALAEQRARGEELGAELEALRPTAAERAHEVAAVRTELARLEDELAARPTGERLAELEAALDGAGARAHALAAQRDAERARAGELAAELDARQADAETLRRSAADLAAELAERPTHEAVSRLRLALDERKDDTSRLTEELAEQRGRSGDLAAALHDERLRLTQVLEQLAERESQVEALHGLRLNLAEADGRERALTAERDAERTVTAELTARIDALRRAAAEQEQSLTAAQTELARVQAELGAERAAGGVRATELATTLEERERELGALRRTEAERLASLRAARDDVSRLQEQLDARPTGEAVAELDRVAGEQRKRADELGAALERATAERGDLLRDLRDERDALSAARVTAARLEGELEGRPTADRLADLQAAVDEQRERAAAHAEELVTVRARGRAHAAALEEALDRQRAKAGELAAALYDERAELEALRQADAERTKALAAAERELAELRAALDKRPTDDAVAQLRDAAARERADREKLANELSANRAHIGLLEARVTEHHQRAERLRAALEALRDGAGELLWSFGFDVRGGAPSTPSPDAPTQHLRVAPDTTGSTRL